MKQKLFAMLLAVSMMLALLTGCGGTEGTQDSGSGSDPASGSSGSSGREVVIGIPGDPSEISPFTGASTGRLHVLPTCYESMGYFTDETYAEFKGMLMESWEVSEDNLTYTIHLYDYIYDSQGNHFTAHDVVYSWQKANEMGQATWERYAEAYYAEDDYTVILELTEDRANQFETICRGAVVTQAAFEASPDGMNTTPVSTGQYILTEYISGSTLVFEKNPEYWQTDESKRMWESNPDKITFSIILEESQMAIALETGAIDIALGMSNNNTDRFVGDDDYNMYQIIGNMCYTLLFNCAEGSVFHDNLALRQAVAYAIDVDDIIDGVLGGGGVKLGTFGFSQASDYRQEWADSYYNYNVERARELLAESGYAPGELNVVLACGSATTLSKTAEMVQLFLLDAGFGNVEIKTADTALFATMKNDSSEWDILLDTKGSQTVAGSASNFDKTLNSFGNMIFLDDDDRLQALSQSMVTVAGSGQDDVDDYVAYLNDMCYVYAMYNTAAYTVSNKNIVSVRHDFRSALIPGMIRFAE